MRTLIWSLPIHQFLDWLTTMVAVHQYGAIEGNSLMYDMVMNESILTNFLFKMGLGLLGFVAVGFVYLVSNQMKIFGDIPRWIPDIIDLEILLGTSLLYVLYTKVLINNVQVILSYQ